MALFEHKEFDNHEQVVFCHDKVTGLKAIIAVHDTTMGPALGGTRMWSYANSEEALTDVLRLSRGMTYKSALAGLPLGGGKAVIIGDAKKDKSEAFFKAYGRFVNALGGKYITAEDVNIRTSDIAIVATETAYVAGTEGKAGDPSPHTAEGTYLGLKAAAKHAFGSEDLSGLRIAVQGLGAVGYDFAEYCAKEGAKLVVCDVNQEAVDRAVAELGAEAVSIDAIYDADVDVYAPCALGATINDETLKRIKAKVIAGSANNQLATPAHDKILKDMGILYAPDYVINAGGVIHVCSEAANFSFEETAARVKAIYNTLDKIFTRATAENRPTGEIADEMAREILAKKLAEKTA
ncbi:Glu/Leu/Phe/Val dehydrogenase dimerization domain-containing protein [Aliidiomarina haloalkalitolerans]|uniref:Amino acid dehydrogenase n=1 Tax=Aliidiomarina haloalkalitolerans TaxID=859059 RepID=A0A432VYF4_9GAMM|nr:Glu/Leu/Phe/Val dehydrogenase dimerization domain-containing protein [Aliidiomarina haloalkalitolerans]RUO21686.1 amino acid dehydrogenase [Aliidiomarina haloalkalitolerans]WEX31986.1 putative valine dehydrogenase [uncultured bacterium]